MQKKLLISALIILALVGGMVFVWQRNQGSEAVSPVSTVKQPEIAQEEKYPQHIEAIPGNTDEVWYGIPEYGVRMRLNKEFAEDLIYGFELEDQSTAYFSSKKITEISSCLLPPVDSPLGYLFRAEGNMKEDANTDEYLAARINSYVQIGSFYYGWVAPQEGCWNIDGKGSPTFPIQYNGSGFKTVSEGIKTLEVVK